MSLLCPRFPHLQNEGSAGPSLRCPPGSSPVARTAAPPADGHANCSILLLPGTSVSFEGPRGSPSSLKAAYSGRKERRDTCAGDPGGMLSRWEKFLLNWLRPTTTRAQHSPSGFTKQCVLNEPGSHLPHKRQRRDPGLEDHKLGGSGLAQTPGIHPQEQTLGVHTLVWHRDSSLGPAKRST